MSNGARHALGVLAGLLLPPLVAAGLWYGIGDLTLQYQQAFRVSWIAAGVLAATAIVLAFLLGSRLSPVASLLGGLAFLAVGVLPFTRLLGGLDLLPLDLLPAVMRTGFTYVAQGGLLAVLGLTLVVVSLFPSRWRGRRRDEPEQQPVPYEGTWGAPEPSPYRSPEDTTRPMFRE